LIPKELRAYFRDIEDHVSRLVGLIDGMRDMLTTAMQVNLALVANNQNEVVKRLAGWGAILAIPTVVFSLYGMNFEWMPELQWKAGYPITVALTALGCAFVYRRLRRAEWV
jgi:magnesium transporter